MTETSLLHTHSNANRANKGLRYLALAAKKSGPEFLKYFHKSITHLRDALQEEPDFEIWIQWLSAMMDTLIQRPEETWLIEIMERHCLEYAELMQPQESDLEKVLAFINKTRQLRQLEINTQLQVFHLAEGFFHYFGGLFPSWNSDLLCLRGELLFGLALASTPPSLHHLQSAGHSYLQAKTWDANNPQIHASLAVCLLYQACYSSEGASALYHMAWHSLCTALRKPHLALPSLEIPEILLYAFVQHLSIAESTTLFRLIGEAWLGYENTPPAKRQFWLKEAVCTQYRNTLNAFHTALRAQLELTPPMPVRSELYLNAWIDILESVGGDTLWLAAWCKLLKSLQPYVTESLFVARLHDFSGLLVQCLSDQPLVGVAEEGLTLEPYLKVVAPLLESLDTALLLTLSKGLYLILAEMLLQGWIDEEGYHRLWLDLLAKQLMQCLKDPILSESVIQSLENAWLALIACSPDEHTVIDSHETLLELMIHASAGQLQRLLTLIRNLYAMLLNRHTCDFNLANLASYLQTLAEHRSNEEARLLLLESCQAYSQACAIAEDDTELLMAWQNALRALAECDPEHAQKFESEADGIYRQVLELMYQRS
ncbi:MAG: hypothetical protein AB7I41_01350 [Candidatus Sericytochromatia bacterium]